jgi:hypothetical protein
LAVKVNSFIRSQKIMNTIKPFNAGIAMSALLVALLLPLSGCEKQGPAEKAGESLDNAVESAGEKVEEAGDAIQDAAEGDG